MKVHSLDVDTLSNLVDGTLKMNGFGGLFSWPLGYVIIMVQEEEVKGYNKDQVVLVILDLTTFGSRVMVTLVTPTINQIMNVIKESEIDELSVSLDGLRISCLLARCQAELSLKNNTIASPMPDPIDLNKAMKTTEWGKIEAFSSKIIYGCTRTVLQEPCLPHGISVVNTYTQMTTGSKHVAIVIKNQTAALIIIGKGVKVTQVVASNRVPPVKVMPGTLEKLNEMQGIW